MKDLSNIEIKIIKLLAEGFSQKQIRLDLGYTEASLRNIKSKLFKKKDVFTSAHLVAWAFRNKILN